MVELCLRKDGWSMVEQCSDPRGGSGGQNMLPMPSL